MIVRELESITNAYLHDAILIATLKGYRFDRVYIDKEGGCDIRFSCKMEIDDIKLFLVNLDPNKYLNKSLEEVDIQPLRDYEFDERCGVSVYSPEHWSYFN